MRSDRLAMRWFGCRWFVLGTARLSEAVPGRRHGNSTVGWEARILSGTCVGLCCRMHRVLRRHLDRNRFLTRIAAAAAMVELFVIAVIIKSANGFFARNNGLEFELLWALVLLMIFFRGGDRFSLDSAIGREI